MSVTGAPTLTGGRPAPMLGEHTREVLSEADYAAKEIDALFSSGAAHGC